jgi:hypothetical protein
MKVKAVTLALACIAALIVVPSPAEATVSARSCFVRPPVYSGSEVLLSRSTNFRVPSGARYYYRVYWGISAATYSGNISSFWRPRHRLDRIDGWVIKDGWRFNCRKWRAPYAS